MRIYIAHSTSYDFVHDLYEPIKQSNLWNQHEIFLPHDGGRNIKTKDVIEKSDLLIAEISYPSMGEGIELGWADAARTRIAAIYRSGTKYSSSIELMTSEIKAYSDSQGLINALSAIIGGGDDQKRR